MVDPAKLDRIAAIVAAHWPERITPDQLGDPALHAALRTARSALLDALDLAELD
ncbi:MAG TPA: N-succinylarginine dihydrolase [Sphingomonas sp.]|uniref:N-succinylarginine dihydrolase n=1 Tax=Sphingomonas sp. TaxID=28214 RepID=UPI002EDA3F57